MGTMKNASVAKRIERRAAEARMEAGKAEAREARRMNRCPRCGARVHQNLSIAGWVQCDRSGSAGFRRDPSGVACSWQGFEV